MTEAAEPAAVEIISVLPTGGGWSLRCSLSDEDQMFLSGARAEESARAMAIRLAQSGTNVEVIVHDLHGAIAGRTRYAALGKASAI